MHGRSGTLFRKAGAPCHASILRRLSGLHGRREGTTRAARRLSRALRRSVREFSSSTAAAPWRTVRPHLRGITVAAALLATMTSTLGVYPHQIAYFNEAAGGPENGQSHLLHSNLDWGQDVLLVRDWMERAEIARSDVRYQGCNNNLLLLIPAHRERVSSGHGEQGWTIIGATHAFRRNSQWIDRIDSPNVQRIGYATWALPDLAGAYKEQP